LVGNSYLHQAIGDEVLIFSPSPDHLAMTATMLLYNTHHKTHFLQVHGGLHHGKLLKRNNNYFGPPLNLASRIASKASAGTIHCSDVFFNSLSEKNRTSFTKKGKSGFKNVSQETELYELAISSEKKRFVDPVCRMLVEDTAIPHPTQSDIYFCSNDCLNNFLSRCGFVT